MWIENLANGKYKYIQEYEDPITGKTRTVSTTHTKKTKAVQEEMLLSLKERVKEILHTKTANDRITFRELTEKFWKTYEPKLKGQSVVTRRNQLNVINKNQLNVINKKS